MFNRIITHKETMNDGIAQTKQTNMTSMGINHKPALQGSTAMQQEEKSAQSLLPEKSKEAGYSFLENGVDNGGLKARASNNLPDCINSGSDQFHLQK